MVKEWKHKLLVLIKGYDVKEVYYADVTDILFREIPTKSLVIKGNACVGSRNLCIV